MRRGLVVASAAVVLATAGAAAAALTAWPEVTLADSGTALARTDVPLLAGRLERVRVTAADGDVVPVRDDHGDLVPTRTLPQGSLLHVDLTVRRPSWAGWLVGRTVERRFDVRTPSVHVRKQVLSVASGAPVSFRLDAKAAVVSIDGRLRRQRTPTRVVRTGVVATGLRSAGTVEVAAAPRAWEELTTPVRVSWFPPATHEGVVATPAPGTKLTPRQTLTLTFSSPIAGAFDGDYPHLRPAVPGRWKAIDEHSISFEPAGIGFPLGATVHVVFPKTVHPTDATTGKPARSLVWSVEPGATLRVQQLLAELGYLPLLWTPVTHAPTSMAEELADAVAPPTGTFTWRYAETPQELQALWHPGQIGDVTRGAIMRFEDAHGLPADGVVGPAVWHDLFADDLAGRGNTDGYSYVFVHETVPQSLNLWHNGKIVLTSPGNTGIPEAPTAPGTYPVFEHIPEGTMSGTNPDGSHYHDTGIQWISYFHGGDAIHAFNRASYGTPQSLGCVELPLSAAAQVWPYTPVGTLVTIEP
jgi:L,D-transpeptidase catalytic domain/Putative peptidoglycan binding domain